MDTIPSGSCSGFRPWRIRRPSRLGSEEVAGRELAFPVAASPEVLPWEVPVDPVGLDGLAQGVADGATVAAGLEEVGVVVPEEEEAADLAVAAVGGEALLEVEGGADATARSELALTSRTFGHGYPAGAGFGRPRAACRLAQTSMRAGFSSSLRRAAR